VQGWGLTVEENSPGADVLIRAVRGSEKRSFDLNYRSPDYRSRVEAIFWNGWFVVGIGGRAVLIAEDDERVVEYDLGSYFSAFVPNRDHMLIVSGQGIVCIGEFGEFVWRNDALGVDGVIVHDVRDLVVSGEGEWDPPGGWCPFRISLATGLPAP
jgi:hypothetical protein